MRRGNDKSSSHAAEPDVEALLSFKKLKDANHPEAIAIWSRYQESGNEAALNKEITEVLAYEASVSRRNAPTLPPGGVDSFPDACMFYNSEMFYS